MKSIVLSSVVMALLVFSGCADKEPAIDEKAGQVQEVVAQEVVDVNTEVVRDDSASITSSDSTEINMASLERDLSSVYFDFDKFYIRSDMESKVTNSAFVANGPASAYSVKLEGNCDEWGSDEYNFALGLKRASAVKKALIAEGVNEGRITMVSYGESNPICNDKTQACWSENRRVDFKLLP